MKKVWIERDEWYPVYEIVDRPSYAEEIELTDKELEMVRKAEALFEKAQILLSQKYHEKTGG